MKTIRHLVTTCLALCATTLAAFAADPSGNWKFQAEGPKGRDVEATLTLKLQDNRLFGFVDNRAGKVDITDATFADDQVSFTVVRKIGRLLRKQTFTTRYSGKLEGDTIKGTIQVTGRDKKSTSLPWQAQRVK